MADVEELQALIDQLEKVFVYGESGFVPYDKLIAGMREALAARPQGLWQPIETLPSNVATCWVGHALSQTMIVAYRDGNGWRIMWSDRFIPWTPDVWMPLPPSPAS